MSEWQDISTAPKNGTKIDLWAVNVFGKGQRFANCHWWKATHEHWEDRWMGLPVGLKNWTPTHWMFPPQPPEDK